MYIYIFIFFKKKNTKILQQVETYHEMEKLIDEGLCKSIGLSNFNSRQVREVCWFNLVAKIFVIKNFFNEILDFRQC